MSRYNATRNRPFRDWVNSFPTEERVRVMKKIGDAIGKSFSTVKSYRSMSREITPLDCVGIQNATRDIANNEGMGDFVTLRQIYPDLYAAFKQGEPAKESQNGTEASSTESHKTADTPTHSHHCPPDRTGVDTGAPDNITATN